MSEPPSGRCTRCGLVGPLFGPAIVVFAEPAEEVQYVNCRRCGAMLVVGRDVSLAGGGAGGRMGRESGGRRVNGHPPDHYLREQVMV